MHHNLKIVGKRKEEKEVVIVETVKRDVNITTFSGSYFFNSHAFVVIKILAIFYIQVLLVKFQYSFFYQDVPKKSKHQPKTVTIQFDKVPIDNFIF